MTYLANLTIRLAEGVARLSDEQRARHAVYLIAAQNSDGGYSGREGASDLYYTGFALRGLALVGELHGSVAQRAADFLKSRLSTKTTIIDFLSLVYGAMLLENAAGVDVFAESAPGWRDAVATELERFRRPDGGYAKTDESPLGSTYYTFLMVLCQQLIGRPLVNPDALVKFVRSRSRDDGGFVELTPMKSSGTNPTAAAAGLLTILAGFDDATRRATIDFLADMQTDEGGLRANTRIPIADTLSTFTGLLTLGDLDALGEIDLAAARSYVESMEQGGGFRGGLWDDATDVEYTFYGLGSLALLAGIE